MLLWLGLRLDEELIIFILLEKLGEGHSVLGGVSHLLLSKSVGSGSNVLLLVENLDVPVLLLEEIVVVSVVMEVSS